VASEIKMKKVQSEGTKWTKNGMCGVQNFILSNFLIQMLNVLGM
jgi:hypothetical protein